MGSFLAWAPSPSRHTGTNGTENMNRQLKDTVSWNLMRTKEKKTPNNVGYSRRRLADNTGHFVDIIELLCKVFTMLH